MQYWLTGTASAMMVGCVEGILGRCPDLSGIRIATAIPHNWDLGEINKEFRGCQLHIVIKNQNQAESGCRKLYVNGEEIQGDHILMDRMDLFLQMFPCAPEVVRTIFVRC